MGATIHPPEPRGGAPNCCDCGPTVCMSAWDIPWDCETGWGAAEYVGTTCGLGLVIDPAKLLGIWPNLVEPISSDENGCVYRFHRGARDDQGTALFCGDGDGDSSSSSSSGEPCADAESDPAPVPNFTPSDQSLPENFRCAACDDPCDCPGVADWSQMMIRFQVILGFVNRNTFDVESPHTTCDSLPSVPTDPDPVTQYLEEATFTYHSRTGNVLRFNAVSWDYYEWSTTPSSCITDPEVIRDNADTSTETDGGDGFITYDCDTNQWSVKPPSVGTSSVVRAFTDGIEVVDDDGQICADSGEEIQFGDCLGGSHSWKTDTVVNSVYDHDSDTVDTLNIQHFTDCSTAIIDVSEIVPP
jgi:hypothetical protein